MIEAAARALSDRHALVCAMDKQQTWDTYRCLHRIDAQAALGAARAFELLDVLIAAAHELHRVRIEGAWVVPNILDRIDVVLRDVGEECPC